MKRLTDRRSAKRLLEELRTQLEGADAFDLRIELRTKGRGKA